MFGYLDGKIMYQTSNSVVIDVNSIGFNVYVPNPYSYELNSNYRIFVYNHIREDESSLYGFKTMEEKDLFLRLINVKGMGPKVASGIFATGSIKGIVDAINKENILYLTKLPKICENLAKQIILDLKGKLFIESNDNIDDNSIDELISVLENLGYKSAEIKKIVPQVDSSKPLEEQVKDSLKLLLK